jgi:hypothetical protein
MTSKQKAMQFLEVTGIREQYSSVIDLTLTYFIAKAEKEGSPLANDLIKVKEGYREEFEGVLPIAAEVISEVFSDDELDELIVLHSTPALNKLRGLAPKIMGRILESFSKQNN